MEIKVSVLMSVYNTKPEYLSIAIESILNQSLEEFEFIIVNDASDCDTVNILDSYCDSRIVRINNDKNIGLTASLNRGIEIAKGKYIARMDADDISFFNRLESQYLYMEKHSDVAVLGCWVKCGNHIYKYQGRASNEWRKVRMLFENVGICHPSAFIRTDFLKEHNLRYDEGIKKAQDYDLWTRCLEYGKMAVIPKTLFEYRVHQDQISVNYSNEQEKAKAQIRTKLINQISDSFSLEELKQFINMDTIFLSAKELEAFFDRICNENKKKKLVNERILRRELTLIWLKIIVGKYKVNSKKQYYQSHWLIRCFSPLFISYLLCQSIIRNV